MEDIKIFDTHTHYTDKKYENDLWDVLKNLKIKNVTDIVLIGASEDESYKSKELCNLINKHKDIYPNAYFTMGIHPDEIPNLDVNSDEAKLKLKNLCELLNDEKCIAVGEVGLDYYGDEKNETGKHLQKEWFEKFIEIANEYEKPLIVHSRDSAKDSFDILEKYRGKNEHTIIHCYSYDKEMAKRYLNLDYYFGIGGVLTFKNAKKLKEALEIIPIEKIVTETDCPYLSPEPYRGERNISSNIEFVLTAISEIKNLSLEKASKIVYENALKVYKLLKLI